MIYLREVSEGDIKTINGWRAHPDLIDLLGAPFRYINLETDSAWFEHYMKQRNQNIRCVICKKETPSSETETVVGSVGLICIDWVFRSAEFYIMIGEAENRGKGIGLQATKAILRHAFCDMNLHRVELTVMEHNQRARKLYEKAGFKTEGIKRDAVYKNGQYRNFILMSILENEFAEVEKQNG